MKILRGRLRQISCGETWFEDEDGTKHPVIPHPECPWEEVVEAQFQGDQMVAFTVIVAAQATNRRSVALARVVPDEDLITPAEIAKVEQAAADFQAEYRRIGFTDFTVKPYVMAIDCLPQIQGNCWPEVIRRTDSNHTHHHIWGGRNPGFGGHAVMGGRRAITYAGYGVDTMNHEHGHNERCGHAGTPGDVYGDQLAHMGANRRGVGFNAPHMHLMGLIESRHVYQLDPNSAATTFLVHPETFARCLRPGEFRAAEIRGKYHIRYMIGIFPDRFGNDRLCVYQGSDSRYTATTRLAELSPGQSYEGEFYVGFTGLEEGVAKVDLRWTPDTQKASDKPFPQYEQPEGLAWDESASGLWYWQGATHQGMEIIARPPNKLVAYWYTADRHGKREWFFIQDTIVYSTATGKLEPVGTAHFTRTGQIRARVDVVLRDRRFALDLEQFAEHQRRNAVYQFQGLSYQGVTSCSYHGDRVGYIYSQGDWQLVQNGRLLQVEGARFSIESDTELKDLGPVEWSATELKLPGGSYQLERVA